MSSKVVVVGGGIAGLAVTRELRRRGGDVEAICLEGSGRPGGNIRSDRIDGYVCEWGPNGFLDNVPATLKLAREAQTTAEARHRLLSGIDLDEKPHMITLRKSSFSQFYSIRMLKEEIKLRRVPDNPIRFLRSDVLSLPGKLRVLGEPFAKRRPDVDESVYDFAARRIGEESARVLVGAMVTGIYAGDARALSLRATFPKMFAMESDHGGLFRAMIAKARLAKISTWGVWFSSCSI